MTTEEKARAYDEALKWMRELYPGLHGATKEDAEHYFPELRESEDERVIRTLYYLVRDHDWLNGATKGEVLAWLEKQKEQKPAWSEEDQLNLNWVIAILNGEPCDLDIQLESLISWLKSIRPSWKPSEAQMDSLRDTIVQTKGYSYSMYLPELYEQLKKL